MARMTGERRSLLIGSDRPIESSILERFRLLLESELSMREHVEATLRDWADPTTRHRLRRVLRAGMRIEAEVHTHAGVLRARTVPFYLADETFVYKTMDVIIDDGATTTDCPLLADDEPSTSD